MLQTPLKTHPHKHAESSENCAADLADDAAHSDHLTLQDGDRVQDDSKEERSNHIIVSMDTLGIAASSLCLVHCLAMPFVIGILPFIGMQFLEGHKAHVVLAGFVLSFALLAVVPGYLKHRRADILATMLIGLGLVLFATFGAQFTLGEKWELPLITAGNLILVATHLRNRGLHKCIDHHH